MFPGCTVPPDRKETELGDSNQETSSSAGKNTGEVLVPCYAWKSAPTATSGGVDISGSWMSFVMTDEFSVRVIKITSRIGACPDILALCETNLDDSIDSGSFSVTGYLSLIQKDSITHIYGLADYVKERLSFARDLLWKTLQILTYPFDWLYFTHCFTSFSSIDHLICLYERFLILSHLT